MTCQRKIKLADRQAIAEGTSPGAARGMQMHLEKRKKKPGRTNSATDPEHNRETKGEEAKQKQNRQQNDKAEARGTFNKGKTPRPTRAHAQVLDHGPMKIAYSE